MQWKYVQWKCPLIWFYFFDSKIRNRWVSSILVHNGCFVSISIASRDHRLIIDVLVASCIGLLSNNCTCGSYTSKFKRIDKKIQVLTHFLKIKWNHIITIENNLEGANYQNWRIVLQIYGRTTIDSKNCEHS